MHLHTAFGARLRELLGGREAALDGHAVLLVVPLAIVVVLLPDALAVLLVLHT